MEGEEGSKGVVKLYVRGKGMEDGCVCVEKRREEDTRKEVVVIFGWGGRG